MIMIMMMMMMMIINIIIIIIILILMLTNITIIDKLWDLTAARWRGSEGSA